MNFGTLRNIALALPETTESPHFDKTSFRVKGKIFLTIDTMKVGQMSRPAFMQTRDGKKAYRIIKLKTRTEAHRANMVDDYQIIQEAARSMQSGKAIQEWIENKISITYIRMDDEFRTCPFEYKWNKIQ